MLKKKNCLRRPGTARPKFRELMPNLDPEVTRQEFPSRAAWCAEGSMDLTGFRSFRR